MTVRVRFAPSPTGHLHIGGARTALFNYLLARQSGGEFIVRIEDTDQTRQVEQADEKFLENLKWLGLDWDEGPDIGGEYVPYRCMERLEIYQSFIDQLLKEGKAYYCYCTREALEKEREIQLSGGHVPMYSGKCRHLTPDERERLELEDKKKVVRFRVPKDQWITFQDGIRGGIQFASNEIGDFVIAKSDGIPTYNFAVAVDDHLMKIAHVVRGEEHLSNTPRQILVFEAFGWRNPEFSHLPLILNPNGRKLSKRDGSIIQFIEQYRMLGYLPEAILNFIALLGWSPGGEKEIFSKSELVKVFSIQRISKSGAIFDISKLNWLNSYYIKRADLNRIVDLAMVQLQQRGWLTGSSDHNWITRFVALYKDRITHVGELVIFGEPFFNEKPSYSHEIDQLLDNSKYSKEVLVAFHSRLQDLENWSAEHLMDFLKELQLELGIKRGMLFQCIRAAVMGQDKGPDLSKCLELLGKNKVMSCLHNVIRRMEEHQTSI